VQKWLTWANPSNWPHTSEMTDFRSIFAHSNSAVTPCDKSSVNANRKSTTHFPVSPRWTSYVVPKPPKGLKNAVSKIWTISCDNSQTVRNRICLSLLVTNRKSHTSFRLVPTSMTLNDLAFFSPNSIDFPADSWSSCTANTLPYPVTDLQPFELEDLEGL